MRLRREDFERIRGQLTEHNRNHLNRPALFEINGAPMQITSVAEFTGASKPHNHGPDMDRVQGDVTGGPGAV